MKKNAIFSLVFLFLGSFISEHGEAMAHMNASKHNLNGWTVFLIDTAVGNEMAMAIRVETGALHDDPKKHAGRAHLWEHIIFQGSKSFPNPDYFFNESNKLGASEANAYTADDHTLYLLKFHASQFEGAANILCSLFREPLMSEQYFDNERKVVINEAKDYKARDNMALYDGLYLYLLPEDHPFRMYHVGEENQLNAMTMADLAELYHSNYRPESSTIFISGNFSRAKKDSSLPSEEQVLAQLEAKLSPFSLPKDSSNLPPTNKSRTFPPLKSNGFNLVEFRSTDPNVRLFRGLIPLEHAVNPIAAETLFDYLNIQLKGSLAKELKDSGITSSFGIHLDRINNLHFVAFNASLTEGSTASKRTEILRRLENKLQVLLSEGLSQNTLEFLRQRNINSYQKMKDPLSAAEYLGEYQAKWGHTEHAYDFSKLYGGVTLEDLQKVARAVLSSGKGLLASYVGPDVDSKTVDPVFGRPMQRHKIVEFSVSPASKTSASLGAKDLEIPSFSLSFRTQPLQGKAADRRLPTNARYLEAPFLAERHENVEGALQAELWLSPHVTATDLASLRVFLRAFQERNKELLTYLDALSLRVSMSAGTRITLLTSGNSLAAHQIQNWFWESLSRFQPETSELERARSYLVQETAHVLMSSFPPIITYREIHPHLLRTNAAELQPSAVAEALKALSLDEVPARTSQLFQHVNLTLGAFGDFSEAEVRGLDEKLQNLFPGSLSEEDLGILMKQPQLKSGSSVLELDLPETKKVGDIALVRAVQGPRFENLSLESSSGFRAFAQLLEDYLSLQVFNINRNEKSLGYVQKVSTLLTRQSFWTLFLGMTGDLEEENQPKIDGDSRAIEIVRGWEKALSNLQNITDEEFEDLRKGIQIRRLIEKVEMDDRLLDVLYNYHLTWGHELDESAVDRELALMTRENFLALAEKYVIESASRLDVISSRNSGQTRQAMAESDPHFLCETALLARTTKELPFR